MNLCREGRALGLVGIHGLLSFRAGVIWFYHGMIRFERGFALLVDSNV